ncbi:MAG: leucyl/phenylalanyl-tRNA--protein transferase [Saprospiraceae bacterium]|nr:leucyl/phenylalanyl-tRNA--protein transferase [Saprospiraceae bacterium]
MFHLFCIIIPMYYYLDDEISFPHPKAVKPSGILAIAGDLRFERLLLAYHYGIFPWYNEGEPIIWWCPNPRYVIFPERAKVPKSIKSYFNQNKYRVTYNQAFEEVIRNCQNHPRSGQNGTWINEDIVQSYINLHRMGYASSAEVWDDEILVGGLYGVHIGKVFYGESMFSKKSNASRFGFISLAQKLESEGFYIIDCQQPNAYLESLGGEFISGDEFQEILGKNRKEWLKNQCY